MTKEKKMGNKKKVGKREEGSKEPMSEHDRKEATK